MIPAPPLFDRLAVLLSEGELHGRFLWDDIRRFSSLEDDGGICAVGFPGSRMLMTLWRH